MDEKAGPTDAEVVLMPQDVIAQPGPAADANDIALMPPRWPWQYNAITEPIIQLESVTCLRIQHDGFAQPLRIALRALPAITASTKVNVLAVSDVNDRAAEALGRFLCADIPAAGNASRTMLAAW